MSATVVHTDEIRWYLRYVNPRATADDLGAWLGVTGDAVYQRLVRRGRTDIADRLARNARDRGVPTSTKRRAA